MLLEGKEAVIGPGHADTLFSIHNLSSIFLSLGKYEEAEAEFRRALKDKADKLELQHPEISISLNNLLIALEELEKYKEAEIVHHQIRKKTENTSMRTKISSLREWLLQCIVKIRGVDSIKKCHLENNYFELMFIC